MRVRFAHCVDKTRKKLTSFPRVNVFLLPRPVASCTNAAHLDVDVSPTSIHLGMREKKKRKHSPFLLLLSTTDRSNSEVTRLLMTSVHCDCIFGRFHPQHGG